MRFNEMTDSSQKCPHCGGPMFSEMLMMEKKDACYYKVKASAKVWPSAYASGRLVQCRKKGAGNYGNKSEGVAEGSEEITWIKPNFDYEWDEIEFQAKQPQVPADVRNYMAKHFPDKQAWMKSVQYGRPVVVRPDHGQKIRNYTDNKRDLLNALSPASHDPQGPAKAKRVNALFDKGGPIEMPIILQTEEGLWLIGGKTRLGTANLLKGIPAKVWMIGGEQGVAEAKPVTIGSKLPKSDTETFGLEPSRPYRINNPKDWKKGDRPRAIQQLIPTQDKKDHIRSRLGKHAAPVLPEQGMAENIRVEPVARSLKTQSTQTQPKQNVYVAPDKKTPAVVNHIKQKDLAEGEGNFVGDFPQPNIGGATVKNIQVGDTVSYLGQPAQVVAMSKDRKRSRITISKGIGGVTQDVLTGDLKKLGQGMAEDSAETPQQQQVRAAINKGMAADKQTSKDEFQSRQQTGVARTGTPPPGGWLDPNTFVAGRLQGIDSIDPDGTVVIDNNSVYRDDAVAWVKRMATMGGMPGVRTKIKTTPIIHSASSGMAEGFNGEYDDEAGMADNNLETLRRAVDGIDDVINTGDNLPEWCQEKIAVAKSMLVSVWDYMRSEQDRGANPELAEEFDLIESCIDRIADHNGVDAEMIWEDLESLSHDELYVFAVTSEPIMEDWQKANKKDRTAGMSQKAVNAYRRENPGSKLQTAVTTKPSKLKKGSKASKRRKSYCSRSRGQMKMHNISCAKTPDKAICKARRRWNC